MIRRNAGVQEGELGNVRSLQGKERWLVIKGGGCEFQNSRLLWLEREMLSRNTEIYKNYLKRSSRRRGRNVLVLLRPLGGRGWVASLSSKSGVTLLPGGFRKETNDITNRDEGLI